MRLRVTPHLAFGICLVAVGSTLALDRLGLADAREVFSRFWPLGLVLLGLSLIIQALQGPQDGLPPQVQTPISNGSLIGLFIVGVIGFYAFDRSRVSADPGDRVGVFGVMGRHEQYSNASAFRGGDMTCVMGHCQLDLREATIAPGQEAAIDVFTVMGGARIRVPAEWDVDVQTVPIAGAVKDRRPGVREPGGPRLVIRGFIMMGGLSIKP
jgi:hypothetical protein